jgi:hypothetical protein
MTQPAAPIRPRRATAEYRWIRSRLGVVRRRLQGDGFGASDILRLDTVNFAAQGDTFRSKSVTFPPDRVTSVSPVTLRGPAHPLFGSIGFCWP